MITLYGLSQSRSARIAWLLEELGLPYEAELFERDADSHLAPASLKKIHPLGKSPVIRDGDLVLAESGAIVEYLIAKYAQGNFKLQPDSPHYSEYVQWLHYAEGSLMPLLVMSLIFRRIENRPQPFFVKPITRKICAGVRESYLSPNLTTHLDYVEKQLDGKTWLLGELLSGADVMMSFPLQAALARADSARSRYPNIAAYVARIEQRPAWQQAETKVGKLNL